MGFTFNKEGQPCYTTGLAPIEYEAEEKVKVKGKVVGKRTFTKKVLQDPLVSYPSDMGWLKKVEYEEIILMRIADPSDNYKIKPKIFLRKAVFDAEKYFTYHKCTHCEANELGNKYHFARSMTDSIMVLCWRVAWRYQRTAMLAQTVADREGRPTAWIKVISEKPVSSSEAEAWCQRNNKVVPIFVQMMNQGAEVI